MDFQIRRGDIVWVHMRDGDGHEQLGKRPAVVIQNDIGNFYSPTTIIAPLTSSKKKKQLPTHVCFDGCYGLYGEQTVLLEQIVTIDKKRIASVAGTVERGTLEKINEAIRASLGLE